MSNIHITPRHIEITRLEKTGNKNPRLTSDRVRMMSGSSRIADCTAKDGGRSGR